MTTQATASPQIRSVLAAIVTASLLLAGCVSSPAPAPGSDGPTTNVTIQHAMGETTLEETPQRIVALEWTYVEDLLALGIQPVGVADVNGYERWVKADPALAENVTDVGTRQEPSLETIASLDPDLIVGVQFRHEAIHDELSKLAPTLLFDPYPGEDGPDQYTEMVTTFRALGKAVDREEQAQAVLDEMNRTFGSAEQRLEAAGATDRAIVLAQAFSKEGAPTLRLFTDNSLAIQILERTGLENAWSDGFQTYGFSTVSLEALERVQNATFLYVAQPDDDPVNQTYPQDPTWRNLTFVQEDRVHALGADTWLFGGPLSSQYAVQNTVDVLTNATEEAPSDD